MNVLKYIAIVYKSECAFQMYTFVLIMFKLVRRYIVMKVATFHYRSLLTLNLSNSFELNHYRNIFYCVIMLKLSETELWKCRKIYDVAIRRRIKVESKKIQPNSKDKFNPFTRKLNALNLF